MKKQPNSEDNPEAPVMRRPMVVVKDFNHRYELRVMHDNGEHKAGDSLDVIGYSLATGAVLVSPGRTPKEQLFDDEDFGDDNGFYLRAVPPLVDKIRPEDYYCNGQPVYKRVLLEAWTEYEPVASPVKANAPTCRVIAHPAALEFIRTHPEVAQPAMQVTKRRNRKKREPENQRFLFPESDKLTA